MNSTQNSISAADTSIGFDYQFYYFFYTILGLKHGEKIGLEVKDDVHLDMPDGTSILIQTKHSVQTSSDGNIINLTERDKDLWKTISNWIKILNEQSDQLAFLEKSNFQLVTNKNNNGNPFFVKVQYASAGNISINDFKNYLKELIASTSDDTIKGYIDSLQKLANKTLLKFLTRITFHLNEDNLIIRIKERVVEKMVDRTRIEDVYNSLHSTLRDSNYLAVKEGDKIEITFQEFLTKCGHCFRVGQVYKLPIRDLPIILPANPGNQNFIKQLIDINALSHLDHDEIIELTTYMLMMYNNLNMWEISGDIGPSEIKKFEMDSTLKWKNSFQSKYRDIVRKHNNGEGLSITEDEIQQAALSCLDEMRRAILTIEETHLDTQLSNGHFYLLTESKNIGWHFDWKTKYGV